MAEGVPVAKRAPRKIPRLRADFGLQARAPLQAGQEIPGQPESEWQHLLSDIIAAVRLIGATATRILTRTIQRP